VNKRKGIKIKQAHGGDAPNADERIPQRDEFREMSFTPIMDALEISLKEIAIIYDNAAERSISG
jgi:hypothetical protein